MMMGTGVDIDARSHTHDDAAVAAAVDSVFARIVEIEETFSTYKHDSEVSRLGRGEIALEDCSDEMRHIVDLAEKLNATTNGFFDIYAAAGTYPSNEMQRSDLPNARPLETSGLVKGWAVEQGVDILRGAGIFDFCINAGGDVFAGGMPDGESGWRIGLQHPYETMKVMAVLEVTDTAIATSALYARGDHIVVPKAVEKSETQLVSLTVVGADITLADAYATAAFAMGLDGMEWLNEQPGFHVFAVDSSGLTHRSPGMNDYLVS